MRWCFEQPELDGLFSTWMQQSAAFFVLLSQMRAMRGVVTHPQMYANKLASSDGPEAVQFRKDKIVGAMQQMLAATCVPTTPAAAPSSNARVCALAAQLVDPQQLTECNGLRTSTSGAHGLQDPATPPSVPSSSGQDTQSSALTNQLMDMILCPCKTRCRKCSGRRPVRARALFTSSLSRATKELLKT